MANGNLEKASLVLAPEEEAAGLQRIANGKLEKASLIGGALAAIVASVCCLGPLALVSMGISGAWISNLTAFEPYRPYAIGVALVCMILAYRKIYAAPAPEACEPGNLCAVPQTRRIYKAMFWVVSAMVLIALGFPYTARFFY
jgi:mercuric ion transport protein